MNTHTRTGLAVLLSTALGCWMSACEDPEDGNGTDAEFDVTITLSELIPTVATVNFETNLAEVEEAYVEFGLPGEERLAVTADEDGEGGYSAILLGMKAGEQYLLQPWVVVDGETMAGEDESLTTGTRPLDLPELSVTALDEERAVGGYFVLALLSSPSAAVIVDSDGDYVWWHQNSHDDQPVPRAVVSRDRKDMLYMGRQYDGETETSISPHIFRVALDGSSVEAYPHKAAHHDFVELPDGTLAMITQDVREIDGEAAVGDKVIEVQPDGSEVDVWTVWDHLEYDPDTPLDPGTNWSHSNALDYYEEDDTYVIGVRNFGTIFHFDRATGDTIFRIGSDDGDYELEEGGEWFAKQHQSSLSGDELLVFSNGSDAQVGSKVLGYEMNDDTMTAVNHFVYQGEFPLYTYTFGDINRLDNGNLLVTWATAGQMEEITPEGELVWQLKASLGGGFGYTTHMDSLYP